MSLFYLTLLSSLLATASAKPSVIFPLYIYPLSGAWLPLTDIIAANPGVHFKVILNPNSGPFPLENTNPSIIDYINNVPNITQYPNAKTYGYVDTNFAYNITDDEIIQNIDAWLYGPSALIPTGGIFFDDVSSNSAAALWQMNNVATYAREDNFTDIIFNCGQAPTYPDPRSGYGPVSGLYDMANEILIYEFYYVSPASTATAPPTNVPAYINTNNHGESSSKLSAMIYSFNNTIAANNVSGGCATAKSALCTFVNSFTGVVESLFVSDNPTIISEVESSGNPAYGGDYTRVPDNFANFVSILGAS